MEGTATCCSSLSELGADVRPRRCIGISNNLQMFNGVKVSFFFENWGSGFRPYRRLSAHAVDFVSFSTGLFFMDFFVGLALVEAPT